MSHTNVLVSVLANPHQLASVIFPPSFVFGFGTACRSGSYCCFQVSNRSHHLLAPQKRLSLQFLSKIRDAAYISAFWIYSTLLGVIFRRSMGEQRVHRSDLRVTNTLGIFGTFFNVYLSRGFLISNITLRPFVGLSFCMLFIIFLQGRLAVWLIKRDNQTFYIPTLFRSSKLLDNLTPIYPQFIFPQMLFWWLLKILSQPASRLSLRLIVAAQLQRRRPLICGLHVHVSPFLIALAPAHSSPWIPTPPLKKSTILKTLFFEVLPGSPRICSAPKGQRQRPKGLCFPNNSHFDYSHISSKAVDLRKTGQSRHKKQSYSQLIYRGKKNSSAWSFSTVWLSTVGGNTGERFHPKSKRK